ncbi:MAG: MinD/ParA family protein [Desulfobacterium sp.]|nr:MinD/ParA family protein [Desulfobacterium sp.]MBU3948920.1 MinD/ParA family protein [Pseudomonadota bacterium]MBU4010753.1 MinD/ParA family protein [Pseudomonadota bacterium]MBU4035948.1 MinD/ParA family protein [Pseudomonadota bacterium]
MDQATHLRQMIEIKSQNIIKQKTDRAVEAGLKAKVPRVIAVASGKGGVGKTNIVVNLAIAFRRIGNRVLIFDADLGLANIDIIFGLNPKCNIENMIKGEKELSQVIVKGPEGVDIIPASSGVQELTQLTEGQKMNLLNEFDMLNRMYDLLLVDTGAGVSSNVIYFNLAAEERMIVVTPEPTSVTDAYALIKILYFKYGIKNFYLLLNMVNDEKEAKSVYSKFSKVVDRFMGGISIDYAGFIPRDKFLVEAVSRRKPVMRAYPDAPSCKSFKLLADYLSKKEKTEQIDGNIKFFWKRLIGGETDADNKR